MISERLSACALHASRTRLTSGGCETQLPIGNARSTEATLHGHRSGSRDSGRAPSRSRPAGNPGFRWSSSMPKGVKAGDFWPIVNLSSADRGASPGPVALMMRASDWKRSAYAEACSPNRQAVRCVTGVDHERRSSSASGADFTKALPERVWSTKIFFESASSSTATRPGVAAQGRGARPAPWSASLSGGAGETAEAQLELTIIRRRSLGNSESVHLPWRTDRLRAIRKCDSGHAVIAKCTNDNRGASWSARDDYERRTGRAGPRGGRGNRRADFQK